MGNIKNYEQFNEMADYNETMTIEDLIYVMEQQPSENFIVAINEKMAKERNGEGEIYFLLNNFIEIPSENMMMDNVNYKHSFNGNKYKFYTHNIETNPENLLGITYIGDKTRPEETNLPPHKTIGELIEIAKKIPNPSKCLFFIPSHPTDHQIREINNSYSAPMTLAIRNITSYPLTKNGVIISGKIGEDLTNDVKKPASNQFMVIGGAGEYEYVKLR